MKKALKLSANHRQLPYKQSGMPSGYILAPSNQRCYTGVYPGEVRVLVCPLVFKTSMRG